MTNIAINGGDQPQVAKTKQRDSASAGLSRGQRQAGSTVDKQHVDSTSGFYTTTPALSFIPLQKRPPLVLCDTKQNTLKPALRVFFPFFF